MSTILYGHPDVPLVLRLEEPIFVSFAPFGRLAWNAGTGEVGPGQLSLFLYGSALRALRSACEASWNRFNPGLVIRQRYARAAHFRV